MFDTILAKLPEFIIHHWILCSALAIIIIALIFEELKGKGSSGTRLSPTDATILINRERAVVFDIREKDSFDHAHIVNAIYFAQKEMPNQLEKIKKYQDKPIILVCKQGQFSPAIAKKLRSSGFKKVYTLSGGIDAWKDAGLPLTK